MSVSVNIAAIRKDYQLAELDESTAGDDPLAFFGKWFAEAETAKVYEVNAMTLATADAQGNPHARIVLLKGLDEKGLVFFTNYNSAKGQELLQRPKAALIFFWPELERQVRIEGKVEKTTEEESDQYFHSRPEGSRLGAWASPQSEPIESRETLDELLQQTTKKFSGKQMERPPHWGGYRVMPERIEFWQGRSNRLHDRILFVKEKDHWKKTRLAP